MLNWLFRIFAALVLGACAYHAVGIIDPNLRPGYPWQRHLFWLIANMIFCYFLLKRTVLFLPVLLLLTLQQLYTHGSEFWRCYSRFDQISIIDLAVIVALPIALIAYYYDTRVNPHKH